MDLTHIIESLNKKWGQVPPTAFTEEEQTFLQTYQPEKRLIIYGSLAPNRPNHHHVEPIRGVWQTGTIKGKLVNIGWGASMGYKGFVHCPVEEQETIQAFILFSEEFEAHWQRLDEFEGEEYQRQFALYELDNGTIGVGFIYALNLRD